MSAPSFVQGGSGKMSSGTALSPFTPSSAWPSGIAANNTIVMMVMATTFGGTLPTVSTPAGWTRFIDGGGVNLYAGVNQVEMYGFWKLAAGSDTPPAISASVNSDWMVAVGEIHGCDSLAPIDAATPTIAVAGTGVTNVPAPALTTSGADRLVVRLGSDLFNGAGWTAPASTTERLFVGEGAFTGLALDWADEVAAVAGLVPARNFTHNPSAPNPIGITFALAPQAAAPAGGAQILLPARPIASRFA